MFFQLQNNKQEIEREKDHYGGQVFQLLDLLKSRSTSTPSTPKQIGKKQKPASVVRFFYDFLLIIFFNAFCFIDFAQ